jgi:plasmid maintenance system antidote protein VapI
VIYSYIMGNKQAQPMMTELLREALRDCESVRAVARATGVAQPSLVWFLAGKQSLRLDNADALARYFGIRVSRPQQRRKE